MAQTAAQIVKLAATIAKGPGMIAMAGQFLNIVLEDLKLNKNLKVNRVTQPIVAQANSFGPFPLEADYLRTYDLFYRMPQAGGGLAAGQTVKLNMVTMEVYDSEWKDATVANYPYEYATDLSTQAVLAATALNNTLPSAGLLYIYPSSSSQLPMTHRYMVNQPDIVTPESSNLPTWFPYSEYLITAVAAHMMGITGDNRKAEFTAMADKMLLPFLIMEGDEQPAVHSVALDPRRFHFPKGLKPTKSQPF